MVHLTDVRSRLAWQRDLLWTMVETELASGSASTFIIAWRLLSNRDASPCATYCVLPPSLDEQSILPRGFFAAESGEASLDCAVCSSSDKLE